jgi:nitrogen fixation/metabolism regulation signal transduction histidine kinase
MQAVIKLFITSAPGVEMTSLKPNLVMRIDRLPKPSNVAAAMQPLFEAISNAIHSTQARFTEKVSEKGRVTVTVVTNRDKKDVWASVEDNGFGLNDENWEAFTTTDTDNKIRIGGKGVGRLLWLARIIHDPLRLVDFPPPFSAEANS